MSKSPFGADILRIITMAALTVGAFRIVPRIPDSCARHEILEKLGIQPPVQPITPCTPTAAGSECVVILEHCHPSMLDGLIKLAAIIVACLIAGAVAGRGAAPKPVRGAVAVGLAAAIALAIESYQFGLVPIPVWGVMVSVSALLGLAGGHAAKRYSA